MLRTLIHLLILGVLALGVHYLNRIADSLEFLTYIVAAAQVEQEIKTSNTD